MPSVVIVTFLCFFFYLCFSPVEETSDQVSGGKDLITPEETEKHHQQETNTEIRITVKEEEEELANSK